MLTNASIYATIVIEVIPLSKNLVEKSNTLNSLMCNASKNMSLNELRFFCIYLSKLNARSPDRRSAEIEISEFEKLFDIKLNTTEFTEKIQHIAGRTVKIVENGKIRVLTLYSEFDWSMDKPRTIAIVCNDKILPYIFELKKNYTSYRLENIAKLNSVAKIRLYELMKQYEKIKEIKFEVDELKKMLMSTETRFNDFRLRVIEPAIKSINENTDITVRYEKVLRCRKCTALRFFISGKPAEKEVIEVQAAEVSEPELDEKPPRSSKPKTLEELYMKYFSGEQFELLTSAVEAALQDYPDTVIKRETPAILRDCIGRFTEQKRKKTIKSDYGYMNTIIFKATEEYKKKHKPQSYDIDEFEKFAINYDELQKAYE